MIENEIKKYCFRLAEIRDIESIMQIISDAKETLKEINVDQWQEGYPNKEVINSDIINNISYVLEENNNILAYVAIIFNKEESYKKIYLGEWLSNNTFIVAHRVAVSKNLRGKRIASILFKNIESLAKINNIKSFKIDTHESNIPMNNFLIKNGFCYCGIIYLDSGDKRLAYEKIL